MQTRLRSASSRPSPASYLRLRGLCLVASLLIVSSATEPGEVLPAKEQSELALHFFFTVCVFRVDVSVCVCEMIYPPNELENVHKKLHNSNMF